MNKLIKIVIKLSKTGILSFSLIAGSETYRLPDLKIYLNYWFQFRVRIKADIQVKHMFLSRVLKWGITENILKYTFSHYHYFLYRVILLSRPLLVYYKLLTWWKTLNGGYFFIKLKNLFCSSENWPPILYGNIYFLWDFRILYKILKLIYSWLFFK